MICFSTAILLRLSSVGPWTRCLCRQWDIWKVLLLVRQSPGVLPVERQLSLSMILDLGREHMSQPNSTRVPCFFPVQIPVLANVAGGQYAGSSTTACNAY